LRSFLLGSEELLAVQQPSLRCYQARLFESLGEFRGVADVKGYAMPASTLFADLVRPPSPKVNDIATLIHTEAYPNPLFVVAPPFRDRDWLLFLESHVTIFLIFSVCSMTRLTARGPFSIGTPGCVQSESRPQSSGSVPSASCREGQGYYGLNITSGLFDRRFTACVP
jgi:hypothetical protein